MARPGKFAMVVSWLLFIAPAMCVAAVYDGRWYGTPTPGFEKKLQDAFIAGDLAAALQLVAAGGKISTPNLGDEFLQNSISEDRGIDWFKLFVAAGANPRSKDLDRRLLHSAVGLENQPAIAKELLKANAPLDVRNVFDETPIESAVIWGKNGRNEGLKLLLAAGADPNTFVERMGESSIVQAAGNGNAEAVGLLLKAGAKLERGQSRRTALAAAAGAPQNELETTRALLANGADPNESPGKRPPALYLAVASGDVEVARALLQAGADTAATGPDGKNAMELAAQKRNSAMIAVLQGGGRAESPERLARRAEIHAAMRHYVTVEQIGFTCDILPRTLSALPGGLPTRQQAADILYQARNAADRYEACVADFARRGFPPRETLVPVYPLLFPQERQRIDASYDAVVESIRGRIPSGASVIEERVRYGVSALDRAEAGEAADRKAAQDTSRWLSSISQSLAAIERSLRPPPKIDPHEFAARIAAQQEGKAGSDSSSGSIAGPTPGSGSGSGSGSGGSGSTLTGPRGGGAVAAGAAGRASNSANGDRAAGGAGSKGGSGAGGAGGNASASGKPRAEAAKSGQDEVRLLGPVLTRVGPSGPTAEELETMRKAQAAEDRKNKEAEAAYQAMLAAGRAAADAREEKRRAACQRPEARGSCGCADFQPPHNPANGPAGCGK